MAKQAGKGNTAQTGKSKAGSQGTSKGRRKTPDVLPESEPNRLMPRVVSALVLSFLALFLLLSMLGIQGAMLDVLKNGARGLLGYGYYLLPLSFGFLAYRLVFCNHEPIGRRIVGVALGEISFSALLHTVLCYAGLGVGRSLIGSLWRTGMSGASGGVIPGLLAQWLIWQVDKVGAIPVLLLLLVISVFLTFRISAAMVIHKRAEKHRKKLEESTRNPEPEPITLTQEITMEDLRILATPAGNGGFRRNEELERASLGLRRKNGVESPFGEEKKSKKKKTAKETNRAREDVLTSDREKINAEEEPNGPKGGKQSSGQSIAEDYTVQVQRLVRESQEMPEEQPTWTEPDIPAQPAFIDNTVIPDPEAMAGENTANPPDTLTEAELIQGAETAAKKGKVTSDQAAQAAEQVAREIEALTDAEAVDEDGQPYQYPPMTMLSEALGSKEDNTEEMRANVLRLEETLKSFNVDITVENVVRGPTVTRYEMELRPGVKMSKITSLHEDLALALGVSGVRVAAVPGKSSIIGIEVPNRITTSVPIREVLSSKEFQKNSSALAFSVGKDIGGNYIVGDISKMPHLLIAGTTGSGKSVCMNSIIVSLLYRATPEQVRLIMIDPKMVELSIYNGIPHLLIPVVTDAKKAAGALQWAVTEMERRYQLLADYKVRDLKGYNKLAQKDDTMTPMPQIVIIIDELADLMLVAAKEVENSIVRIAQKARAAGMHLVIATQRPSTNVITGIMKANIPSRIAFAVASAIDSRIILDENGAEKLVGKGDMLYAPLGAGKPNRVQGCFITDEEAEEVAEFVKSSSESDYSDDILRQIEQNVSESGGRDAGAEAGQTSMSLDGDPLLPDAVEVVLDTGQASTSMLQRRLKLGYAHAARIVDEMEEKGIVGPFEGSKARQLLITRDQWDTMVGLNPKAKAAELEEDEIPFDED